MNLIDKPNKLEELMEIERISMNVIEIHEKVSITNIDNRGRIKTG